MSMFGIFGAGWLNSKYAGNERMSVIILIGAATVSSLLLFFFYNSNVFVVVLLLSLTIAFMYGANTILLTFVPLKYEKYGRVSSVVGFLDFTAYLGAAVAGVLIGFISDRIGWDSVVLSWVVISVLGIVFMYGVKSNIEQKSGEKEVCTT
jgi:OPA family glycerol-3-phosphate transporter-like MFS transporter